MYVIQRGQRPSAALAAGLTSRIDEMLLSLRPLSVTRGYWPGPNVAILVPVKSSSSKNSQVPDSNDYRGDAIIPLAEPPHVAHEMGMVAGKIGAIGGDYLGLLTRPAELSRHDHRGQP